MSRVFIIVFIWIQYIYASDIAIDMHISKTKAYEGEGLVLDVNITQVDQSKVMLFQFTPSKSRAYRFHQVDFHEDSKHHHLKQTYRYLVYPMQSGAVEITFEMLKSITDDSKIAYSISGDRDNIKWLLKKDTPVQVAPLKLEILPLPSGVALVGDYTLDYTIDKHSVEAYEPINLAVSIKGSGRPLKAFDLIFANPAYRIFEQKPVVKNYYLQDSSKSSIEWRYALSAKQSFTLDAIKIKAFNPQTQKLYTLSIPQTPFEIKAVKREALVDKVDYPKEAKRIDWGWLLIMLSYIGVFVAGFLTPRDIVKRLKKEVIVQSDFEIEIEEAKSKKELLALLLAQNTTQYDRAIELLTQEKGRLREIKTLLKETLKSKK